MPIGRSPAGMRSSLALEGSMALSRLTQASRAWWLLMFVRHLKFALARQIEQSVEVDATEGELTEGTLLLQGSRILILPQQRGGAQALPPGVAEPRSLPEPASSACPQASGLS